MNEGIPTLYRGIQFRSRLEATWAAMIDTLGWLWEYEPFDMPGYIPDFAFYDFHDRILGEVKPVCNPDELVGEIGKWLDAGLDCPLLCLGIGLRESISFDWHGIGWWYIPGAGFETATLGFCYKCKAAGLSSDQGSWHCRICGYYDGSNLLSRLKCADAMWADAKNQTQWKGRHGNP